MTGNDGPDIQIQQRVLDELTWDARVDLANVGVTVDDSLSHTCGNGQQL